MLFWAFLLLGIPTLAQASTTDFLWGVGHSAFQAEGSPQPSDWRSWAAEKAKVEEGFDATKVTDFWNQYDRDFALAQKLGANAFRLSIAWERIVPEPGRIDEVALARYEKMIVAARKRGLEPVVTLHHFVLPAWLAEKGGLRAADFPGRFAEYAELVVKRLSAAPASVTWWMTFNEPMVLIYAGYLQGTWPPNHKEDFQGALDATTGIARAHFAAVERIRPLGPALRIGVATHYRPFQGQSGGLLDGWAAKLSAWVFNRQFLDALTTGRLLFWLPGTWPHYERLELPEGRPSIDYMGLNYYGRMLVELSKKAPFVITHEGPGPKNDLGWEIHPPSFKTAILEVWNAYKLPVLVTENGTADEKDAFRSKFIADHVAALREAQAEGAPVLGYFHWSLTDNYEWAEGLRSRFGLVEVDYKSGKLKERPSFEAYRRLIEEARRNAR
jgi:beta-glucosidase